MCTVCGCSPVRASSAGDAREAAPEAYVAVDRATGDLHYGAGAARGSVVGLSEARTITLDADVLGANRRFAERNRAHFAARGVRAFNLLSSPGSGKTTLLCATIDALRRRAPELPIAVIEGDQQTSVDADRIRATGVPAIQVNTGRGCHLDARMVGEAFARLPLHGDAHAGDAAHPHDAAGDALLFVENVGNLVCPALWDLGEAAKIVVLSVTEGEDKPLKYPDMFAAAALMIVNKIDLLPHVAFDVERCIANARRIHPDIEVLRVSATRGDGMDAWLDWLLPRSIALSAPDAAAAMPHSAAVTAAASGRSGGDAAASAATEAALRERIARLEAALAAAGVALP